MKATYEDYIFAERMAEMNRGNIQSQEKGSGARADAGKPSWGLMPLGQIWQLMGIDAITDWDENNQVTPDYLIHILYRFQRKGGYAEAFDTLRWSFQYLVDRHAGDFVEAFTEVIRVWEYGEKKYAAFNWMKGMSWNSVIGCYMRHLMRIFQGEFYDEESGRHHGAHLVCNAMMLLHYTEYYKQGNDLPTRWFQQEKADELGHGTEESGTVL